jgi:integrase
VKMKLSASAIVGLTLPAGKADETCWHEDLAGFGVRMRSSGHKNFLVQYAVGGKTKRVNLGNVTEIEFSKALRLAKDLLAQIRLGGDPAHARTQARARVAETFGSLIKPFMIRQQGLLKPRSLVETRRHLEKLCRPLHALPITAIDRRTIATRLMEIAATNGPSASNRCKGSLGALFSWAISTGLLDVNPASMVDKAIENGPRSRLLSDTELRTVWQALGDDDYGTVVRLLILTGLRRGEIGELHWSEVDLNSNLITIPPSRSKNGRAHLVPMSAPVRAMIETQPRQGDRDRIFRVSAWNNAKTALDKRIAGIIGAPLQPWVLHDLRRKFSTALHDELGVMPHVVEVLLGHHQGGISTVYNKATYLAECERALSRWSDHVSIVTGERATAEIIQLRA